MKNIYILLFFVFPICLFSQNIEWIRTVGDIETDFGQFVRTDTSGNIYVVGIGTGTCDFGQNTLVAAQQYTFIAKYDSGGNNLWAVQYLANNATGFAITDFQINSLREAYVAETVTINGGEVGMLVKVKSNGTLGFSYSPPPGSPIQSLDFDSHNNYIISGPGYGLGFVVSFDSLDNQLWNITFQNSSPNSCARHTADNGFLLTATFADTLTLRDKYSHSIFLQAQNILNTDRFMAKYDSVGHLIWAKAYSDNIPATQMTVDKATGSVYLLEQDNNENNYLALFDSTGTEQWTKGIFGGLSIFTWLPHDLLIHNGSIYYLGGGEALTYSGSHGDFYFGRYDLAGNLNGRLKPPSDTSLIGGGVAFIGNSMVLTGGVIGSFTWGNQSITGDGTNYSNFFLAKMDESNLDTTTGIKALSNTPLLLYPNPAKDELHIQYELQGKSETQLSLLDMLGRVIYQSESMQESGMVAKTLGTGMLSEGIYLIQLKANGNTTNVKVCKE